jgi:uncharacterized protein with HEPN domain
MPSSVTSLCLPIEGTDHATRATSAHLNLSLVRLLEIVGLRNRRIHGYDNVDFDVITDMPMVPKAVIARRERS